MLPATRDEARDPTNAAQKSLSRMGAGLGLDPRGWVTEARDDQSAPARKRQSRSRKD